MPDASPPADNDQPKQPFIPPADRPAVGVNPDTPLSELRVRDLAAILGPVSGKSPWFEAGKTPLKDFFDKPFPEIIKTIGKETSIQAETAQALAGASAFPSHGPLPDPWFDQMVRAIATLTATVEKLTDQVAQLPGPDRGETQG